MIARGRHLQEDRLFDCFFAERRGEAPDPPVAEHLADCDACSGRFADLSRFMTALRNEADDELDAVFPPERLRAQQQEIARRIEHLGRAARVISFPGRIVGRHMTASAPRVATRWIAAAAAAGLFVGVAAGMFYDQGSRDDRGGRQLVQGRQLLNPTRPSRLTPVATDGTTPPTIDADEYFMSDLESALDRPRTRELLAFDALTPHVREIRDVR